MADHVVEANGARIPSIGLGTWELGGRECTRIVADAIGFGYRHIDTASIYGNEEAVGEGLRASGVARDKLFVTTKVWKSDLAPGDFERATHESLERLKLDAVDLLLIHWPNEQIPLAGTIEALCRMKREGFARHIGISNFTVALIDEATSLSTEPLVTNQFECHPYLDQSKVIAATRRHGMAVTAYSPIARGRAKGDAVLERIGKAHGKTAAQVCLRYLVQQDFVVIPRTSKTERLREDFDIFDFALSDGEMKEVATLAKPDGRIVTISGAPQWD